MRSPAFGLVLVLVVGCSGGGGGDKDGAGGTDSTGLSDKVAGDSEVRGETRGDVSPSDSVATDIPGDLAAACQTGEKKCQGDNTTMICQTGLWLTDAVCGDTMTCLAGMCVTREECEPSHVEGCYSVTAMKVCDPSGKGYVPYSCQVGQLCSNGVCGNYVCLPGTNRCDTPTSYQTCLEDGSGWGTPVGCEGEAACMGGKCTTGCEGDIKYNDSSVGCEFWSVDLGQWHVRPGDDTTNPSASTIPHGVVVANPNSVSVKVTFQAGDGTPVDVPDPNVPAGQTKAFIMPVMSLQDSGITLKSIRLRTNHPVTVAQFNPPNNEDFVHTTDASLLYPTNILGKDHFVVTMPSIKSPAGPFGGAPQPSVWGYVTVVAVEPGTTKVTLTSFTAPTEPGPNFSAFAQGATITLQLEQWEVLNVAALAKLETSGSLPDLTGTEVVSSQKVAVFGSHDCYAIGDSACDHLETQLLPVEAWGKQYVAGRMETAAPNQYRVVSGQDGTQITTTPPVSGLNGKTLDRGQWVHVASDASFVLDATGPVQVVQFIAGSSIDGVDPSMTVLVPTQLFRSDYPLLVPTAYDQNFANVVRQGQTPILVNGQQAVVTFQPIANSGWEMANIPVPEGVLQLTSDAPFGLIAYGYASFVSYAYPGGLNGAAPQ